MSGRINSDHTRLAARIRALNPAWELHIIDGHLWLYGNGAPAVWNTAQGCEIWIAAQERKRARSRARREQSS